MCRMYRPVLPVSYTLLVFTGRNLVLRLLSLHLKKGDWKLGYHHRGGCWEDTPEHANACGMVATSHPAVWLATMRTMDMFPQMGWLEERQKVARLDRRSKTSEGERAWHDRGDRVSGPAPWTTSHLESQNSHVVDQGLQSVDCTGGLFTV